jgi:hypothetical protein
VTTEPNLPATTDEGNVPAVLGVSSPPPPAPARPGQNITTGLFPMALAALIVVFVALAVWTLMTTTGTTP